MRNQLLVMDWLDYVKTVPDNSVDLVLMDPAYASMLKWEGVGTTGRMGMGKKGSGSDDKEKKFFQTIPNSDLPDLIQHTYRVLAPGCHAYIMCDEPTERLLYEYAVTEGVFRPVDDYGTEAYRRLVWDGTDTDEVPYVLLPWNKMAPGMGYSYRRQYEFVAFMWKGVKQRRDGEKRGKRRLNDLGIGDVLSFKRVPPTKQVVPTQKPIALFEKLILQSTDPGDVVLDMFMGGGTTAVAAERNGRDWMGCDIDPEHVALALSMIERERNGERVMP